MSSNSSSMNSCSLVLPKLNGATNAKQQRLVVVRYFLDRPGYSSTNSSARFWENPPSPNCTLLDIRDFLVQQNILENNTKDEPPQILAEVYLDRYSSYMVLDAAFSDAVTFDFSASTRDQPMTLDIRLTDLEGLSSSSAGGSEASNVPKHCNMSPAGLYAFTMINGLEATAMLIGLISSSSPASIAPSFNLIYGPYAFFIGGLLQLLVGMWEVTRNNIYGAVAFSAFGCFWLGNGTKLILTTYFPEQISEELLLEPDPWGHFVREIYILFLVVCLLKQTLVMNKTTTGLICVLIVKLILAACEEFGGEGSDTNMNLRWASCVTTYLLSVCAGYVFWVEFTNEVYGPIKQGEPYNLFPWNENSAEEAFGAAGRVGGLQSKAVRLRKAGIGTETQKRNTTTLASVRSVHPMSKQHSKRE